MSFQEVGNQFVQHYYSTFASNRQQIAGLYSDQSCLTYEGEQFMGTEQIMGKMGQLPNITFDGQGAVMDIQPSLNEAILVLVNGSLAIDDSPPMKFTQTFLLAKGGVNGYYIHNEIFRLSLG